MRPHCPGCECGLIILLSSSNKAVGEINGYGKLRWKTTEVERMCVGEPRRQESNATSLSVREERKREGRGGREGGRKRGGRDRMEGWVPPLAVCSYAPLRVFSLTF